MFCRSEDVEPSLLRQDSELSQLVKHLLVAVVVSANGPQLPAIFQGPGNCGKNKHHELHGNPPFHDLLTELRSMSVLQPMLGPEHDGVNLFAQFSPFVAGGKTLTDNSTAVGCSEKFLGWLALPMKMLSDHVPQIVMSAQVAHNLGERVFRKRISDRNRTTLVAKKLHLITQTLVMCIIKRSDTLLKIAATFSSAVVKHPS
jgi:hypothetical protein